MKLMNQIFASLTTKEIKGVVQEKEVSAKDGDLTDSSTNFNLIRQILCAFKDNLGTIIQTKDGLYCMLYINHCLETLKAS